MAVQTPLDPRPPAAVEAPDGGVIEDARSRQRRQRSIGFTVFAAVTVGVLAWLAFGGGGVPHAIQPAGGGDGAAGSRSSQSGSARVLASPLLTPFAYRLGVEDGRVAVIGTEAEAGGCETQLLDARTLRVAATRPSCGIRTSTTPPAAPWLRVVARPSGTAIRVSTRNPATHTVSVSPPLLALAEWDWAHSAIASGNGKFWIYALDGSASTLLEVSATNGALVHRFSVAAGPDPFMVVDSDGLWITQSAWTGGSCAPRCTLWHVAPGSARLVAARTLGVRTQWLMASGHSIYADVLTSAPRFGFSQAIWRLDGPQAQIAYRTPAKLLPSSDFASLTGYIVAGNATQGYFTISQLGTGATPTGVGGCDTAAPMRVVRIDPATGGQSYVATLSRNLAGAGLGCHLSPHQAVFYAGSLYLLVEQSGAVPDYQRVVRVTP